MLKERTVLASTSHNFPTFQIFVVKFNLLRKRSNFASASKKWPEDLRKVANFVVSRPQKLYIKRRTKLHPWYANLVHFIHFNILTDKP